MSYSQKTKNIEVLPHVEHEAEIGEVGTLVCLSASYANH